MKKIIIPVAAIAIVGLVAPKFTGSAINEGLDNFIASVNSAPGYTATIESRETSWFSSSAVVKVGIDPAMFADLGLSDSDMENFENLSAKVNVTAQHGPFLSLNGLGLGLSAWKAEVDESVFREFLTYAEDEKFYSVKGGVNLFGSASFEDKMPSFSVISEDNDGEEIAVSGWSGQGTFSSSNASYSGLTESVTLIAEGVTFEIKAITLESKIEGDWMAAMRSEFYDSAGQFGIESISFDMPMMDTNVKLDNLLIDVLTEKSEDGKLMDIDMDYSIKSIDMPDFSGRDLLIKSEINNIEQAFAKAYQEASAKPAQMEQAMAEIIETKLLPQLQASPEFNITEMSGKVGEGNFSGMFMGKVTGVDALPQPIDDPAFWASKAVVDSKLKLDKAMALWLGQQVVTSQIQSNPNAAGMTDEEIKAVAAQQVDGMIEMFTQQGMITVTADGEYEMTFTMQDGQAVLNGNPIPLPF
ncbi:MAG: hypothetical protein ACI9O6_000010 [Glaciecola sp.]|jgi:uncharacterized protein YdgA (DUF945 family)